MVNNRIKISMSIIFVFLISIGFLSLFICGCSDNSNNSINKEGLELIDDGTLNIGISPDFAPFEILEDDNIVGFDVDVANLLAKDLGLKVNFVRMNFDDIINEVKANENIDIGLSGISISNERQKYVNFTTSYYDDEKVFVAYKKSNSVNNFETMIKQPNVRISVEDETTAKDFLVKNFSNCKILNSEDGDASIDAIKNGSADFALVFKAYVDKISDEEIKIVKNVSEKEECAIAVPKQNKNLYQALNKALAMRLYDGTIADITNKWFYD